MSKPINKEYLVNTLKSFDNQVLKDKYVKKEENHTHSNKDVLDIITTEKVTVWDNKSDFSGDYDDLENKPTIPSIDGLAKTSDIPSKTSQLENDSNFQTSDDITATLTPYAKSADVTTEITTEIAKIVADAPEDFDTLKEMSDWITSHENDASAMNSAIQKNKTDIETLQTDKADTSDLTTHTTDTQNPHSVTKAQVGLENVDNTSDIDKPVSTAQQAEFDNVNNNIVQCERNLTYNIETRATKEELNVERSRIDSFTRLEEGSTTGDAELQDIRVMIDGTISDTAGNAVRTQINELKEDLDELKIGNFDDVTDLIKGSTWNKGLISTTDNTINTSNNKCAYTEFNVSSDCIVDVKIDSLYVRIAELSSDNTFIKLVTASFNTSDFSFNAVGGNKYRVSITDNVNDMATYLQEWLNRFSITYTVNIKEEFCESIKDTMKEKLNDVFYSGCYGRLFDTIGCIGDSLTQGTTNYNGGSIANEKYSYPSYLGKVLNTSIYNWGVAGTTTQNWQTTTKANECFDGEHLCDAYIIGLGTNEFGGKKYTNESGQEVDFVVGTVDDIESNVISFCGVLGRLIKRVNEMFGDKNKSHIFLLTLEYKTVNQRLTDMNSAIRSMANYFENVEIIDLHSCINEWAIEETWTGLCHKNALGYYRKAITINDLMNECISKNLSKFANVQFVNTNYEVIN